MAARFVRYPVFGIAHRAVKGRTPTKEEKKWMDFICQQGCIVCQNEIGVFSPCEPHHMEGKTQAGAHFYDHTTLLEPSSFWHQHHRMCFPPPAQDGF